MNSIIRRMNHMVNYKEGEIYNQEKTDTSGTVFLEDVMKPLGLTVTETARMLGVSRKALSEFVNGKAALSPEMALRISKAANTSAESWMNMRQKLTLWNAYRHEPENVTVLPFETAF